MQLPIIECRNLTKCYTNGSPALNQLTISLPPGRIIGLLGPNGSGKTTLIKLINGLIQPTSGEILINGMKPGADSKAIVSYLPDATYLNSWMKVDDILHYFQDFYKDFDIHKAYDMLKSLGVPPTARLKHLSKGNKEKVQLILVMSRNAALYCLDEPIGGVDPAARDFILRTIISNYSENATILLSTHLIYDIEHVLDEVLFLQNGILRMYNSVDNIRQQSGKSVDQFFREVFRC